jgi:hypothetical protein
MAGKKNNNLRKRNLALLAVLVGLVALFYALTIVKITGNLG